MPAASLSQENISYLRGHFLLRVFAQPVVWSSTVEVEQELGLRSPSANHTLSLDTRQYRYASPLICSVSVSRVYLFLF